MRPGNPDVNPAYDAQDSRLRRTAREEERMAQRRVTLADVAERAGLSTTAASRVLNGREGTRLSDDARQRVIAAVLDRGHQNVAILGRNEAYERDSRRSLAARLRMQGIRRALADRGLRPAASEHTEDWDVSAGYDGMTALLRRPSRPSAVIC